MSSVKKRNADGITHKDEGSSSKRARQTAPTHTKPTTPESAEELSPQPSNSSPATSSTSADGDATKGHAPKSFQDLGIIQPMCDACTALGYKVTSLPSGWRLLLKPSGPNSDTNRSNPFGSAGKRSHRARRDWQREDRRVRTSDSTG